jgi:hypothetical protein
MKQSATGGITALVKASRYSYDGVFQFPESTFRVAEPKSLTGGYRLGNGCGAIGVYLGK